MSFFHSQKIEEVAQERSVNIETGLSEDEAKKDCSNMDQTNYPRRNYQAG